MRTKMARNHYRWKTYHEQRRHNPIQNNAEADLDPYLAMCKNKVQCLIFYLAQNRIHHDQEANS